MSDPQSDATYHVQQTTFHPYCANRLERFQSNLYKIGITEICFGGISIIISVITLFLECDCSYYCYDGINNVYQGIWCGSVLILSGIVGTKVKPTRFMYNANMAMSIVSAIFMLVLIMLSLSAAELSCYIPLVTCHSIILVMGLAAFILNIVHAAFCCCGVCCGYPAAEVQIRNDLILPHLTNTIPVSNGVRLSPTSNPIMGVTQVMEGGGAATESSFETACGYADEPPPYSKCLDM